MNRGLVLALALLALVAAVSGRPYTARFDSINVDELLSNARLYKNYIDCLLAETNNHCTADARELKMVVPDAISTGCEKCSDKQKVSVKRVFTALRKDHPDDWAKLSGKWDPDNTYSTKYKEWLMD